MKSFFHPKQKLHHPQTYLSRGKMRVPQEIPERAEQILTDLLTREQIAGALPVAGKVFELLGIESILLENFEAKQVAGAPGRIPFSFSATSDNQINTVGYGVGADL